uniref:Uncharacterized protein n=1 Tax=Tetranychus urticae TaxID=32264 RepID=T1KAF1_TETUR
MCIALITVVSHSFASLKKFPI